MNCDWIIMLDSGYDNGRYRPVIKAVDESYHWISVSDRCEPATSKFMMSITIKCDVLILPSATSKFTCAELGVSVVVVNYYNLCKIWILPPCWGSSEKFLKLKKGVRDENCYQEWLFNSTKQIQFQFLQNNKNKKPLGLRTGRNNYHQEKQNYSVPRLHGN